MRPDCADRCRGSRLSVQIRVMLVYAAIQPSSPGIGADIQDSHHERKLTAQPLPHRADLASRTRPPTAFRRRFEPAISGGDIASLILPAQRHGRGRVPGLAERIVPIAQEAGIAAIIAEDTRIAGRVKADGIHIDGGKAALAEAIEQLPAEDGGRRRRREDPRRCAGTWRRCVRTTFLSAVSATTTSRSRTSATLRSADGGRR